LTNVLCSVEPPSTVEALCQRLATRSRRINQYGVEAEFNAFVVSRTAWDGRRFAHALRYVLSPAPLTASLGRRK
jgi:hypothetical protein